MWRRAGYFFINPTNRKVSLSVHLTNIIRASYLCAVLLLKCLLHCYFCEEKKRPGNIHPRGATVNQGDFSIFKSNVPAKTLQPSTPLLKIFWMLPLSLSLSLLAEILTLSTLSSDATSDPCLLHIVTAIRIFCAD